jgi:predicted transcriptional regulator
MAVENLSAEAGPEVSTVSRHLADLRNSGIVADRKQGARVSHALAAHCVIGFLNCVEGILAGKAFTIPGKARRGGER